MQGEKVWLIGEDLLYPLIENDIKFSTFVAQVNTYFILLLLTVTHPL